MFNEQEYQKMIKTKLKRLNKLNIVHKIGDKKTQSYSIAQKPNKPIRINQQAITQRMNEMESIANNNYKKLYSGYDITQNATFVDSKDFLQQFFKQFEESPTQKSQRYIQINQNLHKISLDRRRQTENITDVTIKSPLKPIKTEETQLPSYIKSENNSYIFKIQEKIKAHKKRLGIQKNALPPVEMNLTQKLFMHTSQQEITKPPKRYVESHHQNQGYFGTIIADCQKTSRDLNRIKVLSERKQRYTNKKSQTMLRALQMIEETNFPKNELILI